MKESSVKEEKGTGCFFYKKSSLSPLCTALYLHIPFCVKKCLYCDFISQTYDRNLAALYIDVVAHEVHALDGMFNTIYVGGGTPTVLERALLEKLLKAFTGKLKPDTEFTIEANPESLELDKARLFLDGGVNRISLGLQSLDDAKLKRLGRIHDARKGLDAIFSAEKAGFKNISVDFIYGVWNETISSWRKELDELSKLPVTHVSCYGLSYEKKTPIYAMKMKGEIKPKDDQETALFYTYMVECLKDRGFMRYEVSNFSKTGFFCKHNMNYWRNDPYIGIGPSAVSYIDGERSKNIIDIEKYITLKRPNKSTVSSSEKLSRVKSARETAAVKIRTAEGIDFNWFKEKTGYDFPELEKEALVKLSKDGLIEYNSGKTGIKLTDKGFLFCDTASSLFL